MKLLLKLKQLKNGFNEEIQNQFENILINNNDIESKLLDLLGTESVEILFDITNNLNIYKTAILDKINNKQNTTDYNDYIKNNYLIINDNN